MSTLVACLGSIFRGDDAFGVEVARRLSERAPIPGARVRDFGVRGLDFAYALLQPWERVVVVDASPRGRPPGTLYLLEVDPERLGEGRPGLDPHALDPLQALRWARGMGAALPRMRIVACEPERVGSDEDMIDGLSPAVAAALDGAVELVERACTSWD